MASLSDTRANNKGVPRILRFLAVGAVGTILGFCLLILLRLAGMSTLLANSFSFTAGLIKNFTWSLLWTFNDRVFTDWRKEFVQFSFIGLFGLAIVLSLDGFLRGLLGQTQWGFLRAKVIAPV